MIVYEKRLPTMLNKKHRSSFIEMGKLIPYPEKITEVGIYKRKQESEKTRTRPRKQEKKKK